MCMETNFPMVLWNSVARKLRYVNDVTSFSICVTFSTKIAVIFATYFQRLQIVDTVLEINVEIQNSLCIKKKMI